jgi:hypothetical protein
VYNVYSSRRTIGDGSSGRSNPGTYGGKAASEDVVKVKTRLTVIFLAVNEGLDRVDAEIVSHRKPLSHRRLMRWVESLLSAVIRLLIEYTALEIKDEIQV